MTTIDIGVVVNWKIGNTFSKGIIRDILDDEFEIVCFEINGKNARTLLKVKKELCTIEE